MFSRGVYYVHPGWKRFFTRTNKPFGLSAFTSSRSDLKWSMHAFFYGAKLPVQDNSTLFCSFLCTKQPRYYADCIDRGPIFRLEEKSLVSSWSKEEGTRISRVEECLVTIIGIEEVIVACHALLPPFFHLLFSSRTMMVCSKETDSFYQTIIIQNFLFFL